MGLATLNVWVHDATDTCKISDGSWFVTVTYCNGAPVEWCGHTYSGEPAKCGHAEFRLPPGCYVVRAFQWLWRPPFPLLFFTEHAIVIVNCDEFGCVHLYTPTARQHPGGAAIAVRFLAESEKLPKDKVDKFVDACNALREVMPETSSDVAFDKLVQLLAEDIKKNRKRK